MRIHADPDPKKHCLKVNSNRYLSSKADNQVYKDISHNIWFTKMKNGCVIG